MASALAQCKSFGSSYDLVMEGWDCKENHEGVVYFVNGQRKITSWIHPYVNKVFEELGGFSNIKYAAYRTALKLRFLQVKLGLSWISINCIKKVFSSKTVVSDCSSSEDTMTCREIFSVVYEILDLSDSFRLHRDKLVQVSEIILNLILELYDTSRGGKVAKRSVRIVLVALCSAKLSDKYRFFFDEISDDQSQIQREKFLYLIYDLMQITELLKESTAFGTNVSAAVNSCLKNGSGNDDDNSTSEESSQDTFYSWLLQEPISIIWLPTLHRVIATETIRHNVECCACNTQPIVGFRYRCMQCFRYDLCQSCFFKGRFSQGHRLKHPMQEYCFPTTRRDNTKALLKIVRNKMSKRHRRTKIKLLPVDDDSITGSVFQWQPRSLIPDPRSSFHSSTDSGLAAGSSDTDVSGGLEDQAYDDDNLAMMKRWCKPMEVLGEPCNTSSPCLQENMSKKNMDSQQFRMAQTIHQLQEENRLLRQKLSAVRKRELEEGESSQDESIKHIPTVVMHENNSGDPLKEITTDTPISPINPFLKPDGQTLKSSCASYLTDSQFGMPNSNGNMEISVNVLEIVGSCTPIQSTFFLENNSDNKKNGSAVGSNEESGISEDGDVQDFSATSTGKSSSGNVNRVGPIQIAREEFDLFKEQRTETLSFEPMGNQVVISSQMYPTDTETESTTSNGLEYTYSDMSLSMKSEATSCRSSQSSKTYGVATFETVEWPKAEKEHKEMEENAPDINTTGNAELEMSTVHDDDTNPICYNGNSNGTSDFLTPNSTKNETSVELDAFKLCQMRFTKDDELDKKGKGGVFDVSNSQPRLIYSSVSQRNRMDYDDEHPDFSCDSFQASKIVIDGGHGENKTTPSQFHSSRNSFYPSFNLSSIPTQQSTASFSFFPKSASSLPPQSAVDTVDNNRRKTMEPVYMSTPVMNPSHFGSSSKSSMRKKSTLAKKVIKRQHEKENRSPLSSSSSRRSRSSNSISSSGEESSSQVRFSRKDASSFGVTPKSSIPPSQRQRILLSMDRLQSNRSYSCNDLSLDREVGMTTLFDRAEHHRTIGAGSQSLALEDKEELERLIDQVRIGESHCSELPPCVDDVSNSSMLQAVLNVGDAMADFVQATANVRLRKTESTRL